MSVPTPAELKAFAPELASVSDAQLQFYIDLSGDFVAESVWKGSYSRALTLLSAHFALSGGVIGGSAGGALTSEAAGDLSRGFSASKLAEDSSLGETSYGRMYLALRRARITHSPMIV